MHQRKLLFSCWHVACWFVLILAVFVTGCGVDAPRPDVVEAGQTPARAAQQTLMPRALRAAYIDAAQRAASTAYVPNLDGDRVRFDNPAQGFSAVVDRRGLTLEPHASSRPMALRTARFGCEGALVAVDPALPTLRSERIEVAHAAWLTEWYVSGPLGVEHGYDVSTRTCTGLKRIELAVDGAVSARLEDADGDTRGDTVRFVDGQGRAVVAYTDLFVTDARGVEVPAWFALGTGDATNVVLVVDDATATYPLRIDPLMWLEQTKLKAADGAAGDWFGYSVALSGDTALVGAPYDDKPGHGQSGLAHVFVRNGTAWAHQAQLMADDGAGSDYFGWSVALSGDTALVGAYGDVVGANIDQGSAYVFVRNGTTWTQQDKLVASDGAANDMFGWSVAMSGDTALVGAYWHNVGAHKYQGAAYVFVRNGTTWSQEQQLNASDGAESDYFGYAVTLSGDTAIVGAYGDDVDTNDEKGSAYVFVRNGTTWTEEQKLVASDAAPIDWFGNSIALSGNTAIVGAPYHNVGANAYQGSAYVFVRSGTMWSEQKKLVATNGAAHERFGNSVALSGDTAIVGAYRHDVATNQDQGSSYMFVRSGTVWTQQQELTITDGMGGDWFGMSVAIFGDTAIVGTPRDDIGMNSDQGSAYVFGVGGASSSGCVNNATCPSGFCVDGVCCNVACGGGDPNDCEACSMAGGASVDGVCAPIADGAACSNGVCQAGICSPDTDGDGDADVNDNCPNDANPLQTNTDGDQWGDACDPDDDEDGIPDQMDGCPLLNGTTCACDNPVQPIGTACDDHSECTNNDVCDGNGICKGTFVAVCPDVAETCNHIWCNPTNGICSNTPLSEGAPCSDPMTNHEGKCVAGGCLVLGSSASSGSAGGTSGMGGSGGMGSGGVNGMGGIGGMGGFGGASSAGGTSSSQGPNDPNNNGELRLLGSGLHCQIGHAESTRPLWSSLAFLVTLLLRRRVSAARSSHTTTLPNRKTSPLIRFDRAADKPTLVQR